MTVLSQFNKYLKMQRVPKLHNIPTVNTSITNIKQTTYRSTRPQTRSIGPDPGAGSVRSTENLPEETCRRNR